MINNTNIREKFFDMFIVDSLIGNTDRHNGNWGILIRKIVLFYLHQYMIVDHA